MFPFTSIDNWSSVLHFFRPLILSFPQKLKTITFFFKCTSSNRSSNFNTPLLTKHDHYSTRLTHWRTSHHVDRQIISSRLVVVPHDSPHQDHRSQQPLVDNLPDADSHHPVKAPVADLSPPLKAPRASTRLSSTASPRPAALPAPQPHPRHQPVRPQPASSHALRQVLGSAPGGPSVPLHPVTSALVQPGFIQSPLVHARRPLWIQHTRPPPTGPVVAPVPVHVTPSVRSPSVLGCHPSITAWSLFPPSPPQAVCFLQLACQASPPRERSRRDAGRCIRTASLRSVRGRRTSSSVSRHTSVEKARQVSGCKHLRHSTVQAHIVFVIFSPCTIVSALTLLRTYKGRVHIHCSYVIQLICWNTADSLISQATSL